MHIRPAQIRNGLKNYGLTTALLIPLAAIAQDDTALSEDYFFDDLPVVLSATRLSQPISDIPASMTVIDADMIRASGALNVPDLLRLVPGFTVGFYSGTRSTASYHGMADEYARDMQVLLDGRSIYDPAFGGVSWPNMPIEVSEINRIEVIRGPNAAAYGSNSYAGVINIITEHPADQRGAKIKAVIGGANTRQIYGRYAGHEGDTDYSVAAKYHETSGYDSIPDDEKTQWVNLSADYAVTNKDSLLFRFGGSKGEFDEGFEVLSSDIRQIDDTHHYQQIKWDHRFSEQNDVSLQFYHNYFNQDDQFESLPLSQMILGFDDLWDYVGNDLGIPLPTDDADRLDLVAMLLSEGTILSYDEMLTALEIGDDPLIGSRLGFKSHRYDIELQQTLSNLDDLRFVWGAGYRYDSAEGEMIFHTSDTISRDQVRLFGNLEWQIDPSLVANLGLMIENYQDMDPLYSPRLGLNYHFNHHHTARISGSRAYRVPTLYENNVNRVVFIGEVMNDFDNREIALVELEAQCIDSYELGYIGTFSEYGLTVDAKLFRERYTNIIDQYRDFDRADPDRGLTGDALVTMNNFTMLMNQGYFSYLNTAEAEINGFELNLNYRPTPNDLVFLGYSYLDAEGKHLRAIKDGNIRYGTDNSDLGLFVPDHTFSLLGSHRFSGGFTLSAAYYFTDDMHWWGNGDPVPSYSRVDLRFGVPVKSQDMNGEVSLYLQNINDRNFDFYKNSDRQQNNIWEPRFFLQASLKFD